MKVISHLEAKLLILAFGLVTFAIQPIAAQSITGSIVGTVLDPGSAAVPGVEVVVRNQQTNAVRRTVTNESGNYIVSLLPPGTYIVEAGATGFKLFRFTDVRVDIDKTTRLDVTFQIGEVTESISVSEGGSARLETDTVSLGQVVNQKTIVDLPISRNFISLAAITAGVVPVSGENGQSLQTGFTNRGNLSAFVSGQRESSVSFLIDGVESRGERLGNASMPVSVDAIQQFSMQRNSMSAEYGNSTAVVNVSVKSGTNDFHGTLFHFLQNSVLNARNFFDGDQKSQTRFNDFGGSVGGPLRKDKTFFFFNYEGVRTRRNSSLLGRFPTVAQLNGDFSALPVSIYDPLTTNPTTGERSPFPGNIIPPDRIDPVVRSLSRYIPAPNLSVPVNNNFNYRVSPSSKDDSDQYHIRIDHQLSSKDSLFGRWSSYDAFNNAPGLAPLYGQEFPWTTFNSALQETHVFGPRALNEFRFGYSRDNIFQTPEGVPGVILAQEIGLRNTVTSPRDGGALPLFIIPGFNSIGGGRPTGYISNRFQLSDTFTITRGNHSLKLGADIRRLHYNVYSSNVPNGQLNFARSFTTRTAGGTIGGDALADFLLGAFSSASAARTVNSPAFRNSTANVFIQDEWKATQRLHLSLGLRWEYPQRPHDVHDRIAVVDFQPPGRVLFPLQNPFNPTDKTLGNEVRNQILDPDWNNFGPRLGLAYDAGANTVIRAAYGIFYDVTQANELNFLGFVPPFQTVSALTNPPTAARPERSVRELFPDPGPPGSLDPQTSIFSHIRTDKTPYVQQFNFNVQHKLLNGYIVEASYVGSLGRKQSKRRNYNQRRINAPVPFVPLPNLGFILTSEKNSNSSYNAAQLRLERQFTNGFSFLVNYTFSKSLDLDSAGAAAAENQNADDVGADRGLSDFDVRHRLVSSYTYELPFGQSKPFLADVAGIMKLLVSGWQLNGITSFQSGFPLNIIAADTSGAGSFTVLRANRVKDGNLSSGERTIQRYFDITAFEAPRPGTFGNGGRNTIIGPGINNWNFSLLKNTVVGEKKTLQFRAEFFNGFNHPQFFAPGNSVSSPATFGRINSARSPRSIQFGLKFNF